MHVSRLPARLRPGSASADDAALELAIGDEVIEVRVDREGIHFRHASGEASEGCLPWDVAIAMSLLPEGVRRSASSSRAA